MSALSFKWNDDVLRLFEIDFLGQGRAISVITPVALSIIEPTSGKILKNYNALSKGKIIDAIYFDLLQQFVVITTNQVIVVPLSAQSQEDYKVESWPVPIRSISRLTLGGHFLIICDNDVVAALVVKDGKISPPPLRPFEALTSSYSTGKNENLEVITVAFHLESQRLAAVIKSFHTNQKKQQYFLWIWDSKYYNPLLSPEFSEWITYDSSLTTIIPIPNSAENGNFKLLANSSGHSFSVFVTTSTTALWHKFSVSGQLLFSQPLSSSLSNLMLEAEDAHDLLYLYAPSLSQIHVYNFKSGQILQPIPFPPELSSASSLNKILLKSLLPPAFYLIQNFKDKEKQHSLITEFSLPTSSFSASSLLSSITFVKKESNISPINRREKGGIIEHFAEEVVKDFKSNIFYYYRKIYQEEFLVQITSDKFQSVENKQIKTKQFYTTIDSRLVQEFLSEVNDRFSSELSSLDSIDWEFLKVCIRSGMVTIQKNPHIISQSIKKHRFDVLCEIILFVSDLTEYQVFSLFYYLFNFPPQELVHFVQFGRTIVRKEVYVEEILQQLASLQKESGNKSEEKKEKDKKRKRADASSTEDLKEEILDKINYRSSKTSLNEVQIIQIFLELFVSRKTFFSAMAISESIMASIPNISIICLMIRLITTILQDHFYNVRSNTEDEEESHSKKRIFPKHYHYPTFTTLQLTNLLTFLEGIMDGCFLPFALQIHPNSTSNHQKEILRCLTALIQVIQTSDESFDSFLSLHTLISVFRRVSQSSTMRTVQQHSNKSSNDLKVSSEGLQYHELHRKTGLEFYVHEKVL